MSLWTIGYVARQHCIELRHECQEKEKMWKSAKLSIDMCHTNSSVTIMIFSNFARNSLSIRLYWMYNLKHIKG